MRLLPLVSSELEFGSMSDTGLALRFPVEEGLALISSVLLLGGVRRSDGVWLPLRPLLFEAARVLLLVAPLLSDELLFSLIGVLLFGLIRLPRPRPFLISKSHNMTVSQSRATKSKAF